MIYPTPTRDERDECPEYAPDAYDAQADFDMTHDTGPYAPDRGRWVPKPGTRVSVWVRNGERPTWERER